MTNLDSDITTPLKTTSDRLPSDAVSFLDDESNTTQSPDKIQQKISKLIFKQMM